MDRADIILAAVRQLYDAILEPDGWDRALQPIVATVGGDCAVLLGRNVRSGSVEFTTSHGMPPEAAAAYGPAVPVSNVVRSYLAAMRPDTAYAASNLVPTDVFTRSRFYNETVRPTGVLYGTLALLQHTPGHQVTFATARSLGRADYEARDIETLQNILPHLATALRLRHEFGAVSLMARDAGAALDRLDIGVILVDARGRPRFVNRRARTIAARADGLSLGRRGVAAARAEETRALHRAIAAAAGLAARLSPSDTVDSLIGAATTATAKRLRLTRPSSKPPLAVTVAPLCGSHFREIWDASSTVAVLVSEPDSPPRIDLAALAETYGLAPREVQVAALLARGLDPKEIACALGIGLGTAREHLKRALAKTDTHRQANLVRLVLSDFTLPLR